MNMKRKTLAIALTAIVSGVSGSAMAAWTQAGTGSAFEMAGTVTPVTTLNPWEVQSGSLSNLDAKIKKGETDVVLKAPSGSLVLGIRTKKATAFIGGPSIAPQISFGGTTGVYKLDFTKVTDGKVSLTVDVQDASGVKIGKLATNMFVAAETWWQSVPSGTVAPMFANGVGQAFNGGLPTTARNVVAKPRARVDAINPEVTANFTALAAKSASVGATNASYRETTYQQSGYYAAGLEKNENINLTLDNPMADTAIKWKASLPVTVSYR